MVRQRDKDVVGVTHEVAINPNGYRAIREGRRRFAYRRGGVYREGDRLHVRESSTGEEMRLYVTDVVRVPLVGEPDDLVIMSIVPDLEEVAQVV